MSLPKTYINDLLHNLSDSRTDNLLAQADARRILQEVKETSQNFPKFDVMLTEKSTHIAYLLLSCGCSIIENEDSHVNNGFQELEKAGKILSDVYKYDNNDVEVRNYNLLIAGMALYASKQYSRAFIVLSEINVDFSIGQMIIKFIKKDFSSLSKLANNIFFSQPSEYLDIREFDEWVIEHEISRCFLIILDFIDAGNQENFNLLNDILSKLTTLSMQGNSTLYWLIIRLLKIIFSTLQTSSLWSVLPPLLPIDHITINYIRLLRSFKSPVIEIWPSQIASLPLAVGENRGAVINLRTSAGKTRIAEIAILKTLSTNPMLKVLYLAPFRSLAFEIEQNLSKTFSPLDITVSQLYGGCTANITDFELINQSQVIIATPEKAKALIRCGSGIETELGLIVIDEGHLLGAEERHIKNEMFFTHIKEYASRNQIRILLLSAVLPNAGELAQWITDDSDLVTKSDWKPALERLGLLLWDGNRVRIEWKSEGEPFNPNFIQKYQLGFSGRRKPFPNNKKEAIAATAVRLSQSGTVMIYSARANSIEGLAESVLLALGEHPVDYTWDKSLWNVFESVCAEELDSNDVILRAAKKGVICHNNRLPSLVRIALERLMRSKAPLIVIASSTLGQGVNVGISTVIVSTPYYSNETISKRDFWNICGRAGRAFTDVEGKILYTIDTTEERWKVAKNRQLAQDYFNDKKMEKVKSGLFMLLKWIYEVSSKTNTDVTLFIEAIANDFVITDMEEGTIKDLNEVLDYLDDGLLSMHEDFNEENTIDWVDTVFRKSLALIQANAKAQDICINILNARTIALLNRFPNRIIRKKLIAAGVPLSVSKLIFNNVDYFRTLALDLNNSIQNNCIEKISKAIRKLEIWSNENAKHLMNTVPEQGSLDAMRPYWISGTSLAEIATLIPDSDKIAKDYYGYTLPWIIHAIAQMFDQDTEADIVQAYSSLAMLIELGLPNSEAVSLYMAGIRSRTVALELSALKVFKDKMICEIKNILIDLSSKEIDISDNSRVWIELFSESAKLQIPRKVSFPIFTWKKTGIPNKLYIREYRNQYFLCSSDGYFYQSVESTDELPFAQIANIDGLYFEFINNEWHLKSYNPAIIIDHII